MTAPISFFADHPVTRQAEQARRQRDIDFARGSVRLEGGHLTDEIERLNARYVAGQIDSDGLTTAILASETARSSHGPKDWTCGRSPARHLGFACADPGMISEPSSAETQ